jgi:hypothetical protein
LRIPVAVWLLASAGLVAAGVVSAQHQHHPAPPTTPAAVRPGPVSGPRGGLSNVPTPAFDAQGRLFVAFVEADHVYVARSADGGQTFGAATRVNPEPEKVDANGEARPKIALGPQGQVYVSYTQRLAKPYTGNIRFARSTDGGRTFSAPVTVNDDGLVTGHRFDALAVGPQGDVHLAWIDKRDLETAQSQGRPYKGGALYHAVSRDDGRSFSKNRKLKDEICECCRIAFAFDRGVPVLLWRDILSGGLRDHSLLRLDPSGPLVARRASVDDWAIEACPHHGPALAVDRDGAYHLAWFSAGTRAQGLLYSHSRDHGRTYSSPHRFGSAETSSHPALLSVGQDLYVAWKESLPEGVTAIRVLRSQDGGRQWSGPREAGRTTGTSDHPILVVRKHSPLLSWFTVKEGYRLLPL